MNNLWNVSTLNNEAEKRLHNLKEAAASLEKRLTDYPAGKLRIVKDSGRIKYYLRLQPTEKNGTYLRKNQQKTIQTYLQKSYDEKLLKLIKQELKILERFMHNYQDYPMQIISLYERLPEKIKSNIHPFDMSDESYADTWRNIPYVPKSMSDGISPFVTERGEYVRSKSELNIANALNKFDIPYKYECPLRLRKGLTIHPDFTVLNRKTRTVYFWEHHGMMDDREYARHAVQRHKDYARAGIYLGKNLIITEETSACPLGSKEIADTITAYLLD